MGYKGHLFCLPYQKSLGLEFSTWEGFWTKNLIVSKDLRSFIYYDISKFWQFVSYLSKNRSYFLPQVLLVSIFEALSFCAYILNYKIFFMNGLLSHNVHHSSWKAYLICSLHFYMYKHNHYNTLIIKVCIIYFSIF